MPSITLRIADEAPVDHPYPTSRIQKGLLLYWNEENLAEEAVGFGLPVLNTPEQTIFPGAVELVNGTRNGQPIISALYTLNIEERIARADGGDLKSAALLRIKRALSRSIIAHPPLRNALTFASTTLRGLFGLATTYQPGDFSVQMSVTYTFSEQTGTVLVETDTGSLPREQISEVILMNEQGAHYFDSYSDLDVSRLRGKEIGLWDLVTAEHATFESTRCGISYTLARIPKVRLYRGRELEKGRLAWSGFGYSLPVNFGQISYSIRIKKSP